MTWWINYDHSCSKAYNDLTFIFLLSFLATHFNYYIRDSYFRRFKNTKWHRRVPGTKILSHNSLLWEVFTNNYNNTEKFIQGMSKSPSIQPVNKYNKFNPFRVYTKPQVSAKA